MSKTKLALQWIAEDPENRNPWQASKQFGLAASVIYRAIKSQQKPRCPTCGQPIHPKETS